MARHPDRRRSAARRGGLAVAAAGAVALLGRLPLTAAAFTDTTANGSNTFAAATSFCSAPGSVTLTVLNDTMVVQKNPTTNYGSAAPLEVRSHSADNKRIFLRPNLPTIPARCTLESAVLTMTVRKFTTPARTYAVYRPAADWGVGTLTWNNQPGVTGTPATATVTASTWQIDVVGPILDLYSVGNWGLVIKDTIEDGAADKNNQFDSLDGTEPATVTYTWG